MLDCDETAVFPAPAGINRERGGSLSAQTGVPRASGDKPWGRDWQLVQFGCSPRQRG
ncbi:hypothetical protein HRI91_001396 [Salmonella enterica]|nr:hypothetical protein [Salmonella enterica]